MSVIYQNKTYRAKRKKGHLSLDLSGKKITHVSSIEGLEDLHDLEVLDLSNNSISEIEGLEALRIHTLKGLDTLAKLRLLNLYNCKIGEIESLENKQWLQGIALGKNPIYSDLYKIIKKKKSYFWTMLI